MRGTLQLYTACNGTASTPTSSFRHPLIGVCGSGMLACVRCVLTRLATSVFRTGVARPCPCLTPMQGLPRDFEVVAVNTRAGSSVVAVRLYRRASVAYLGCTCSTDCDNFVRDVNRASPVVRGGESTPLSPTPQPSFPPLSRCIFCSMGIRLSTFHWCTLLRTLLRRSYSGHCLRVHLCIKKPAIVPAQGGGIAGMSSIFELPWKGRVLLTGSRGLRRQ